MAERSLSDLNIELEAVNKSLDEQTVGQGRLIDAVEDLVRLQRRNLDDLESKIEDKDDDAPAAAPPPRGAGGGECLALVQCRAWLLWPQLPY